MKYTIITGKVIKIFGFKWYSWETVLITRSFEELSEVIKRAFEIPQDKRLPKGFIERRTHTKEHPCTFIIGGNNSNKRMRILKHN